MGQTCSHCKQSGHNARTCTNPPIQAVNRTSGAQLGNTNARKHGFYASSFTNQDLQALARITDQEDLSSEIDLLRVAINRAMTLNQNEINIKDFVSLLTIIVRATGRLGQLTKIRKLIKPGESTLEEFLEDALSEVIKEFELKTE
jgi:hypothetical protein